MPIAVCYSEYEKSGEFDSDRQKYSLHFEMCEDSYFRFIMITHLIVFAALLALQWLIPPSVAKIYMTCQILVLIALAAFPISNLGFLPDRLMPLRLKLWWYRSLPKAATTYRNYRLTFLR